MGARFMVRVEGKVLSGRVWPVPAASVWTGMMCSRVAGKSVSILAGLLLFSVAGCNRGPVEFAPNRLYSVVLEKETGHELAGASRDVQEVLSELFGTPDKPQWPSPQFISPDSEAVDTQWGQFLDLDRVGRAAGAVSSDKEGVHFGLYREHCNACHGISGDGRGPVAALQNPYPRDFRAGIFKYKSTPRAAAPRREDLLRTLQHGLPGTAMPAFHLIDQDELESLVEYVIYLAVRGEVERRLLAFTARELDYSEGGNDRWLVAAERDKDPVRAAEQMSWIADQVNPVMTKWATALAADSTRNLDDDNGSMANREASAESIAIGRELFHGPLANCSSCHGEGGNGQTRLPADYDDWTKEWTTRMGLDPKDKEALQDFFAAGALRPKPLPARALTRGVFRGGDSAQQIYLRVLHGIDGTPMPAIHRIDQPGSSGLTVDQIWAIVHYVQSLSASPSVSESTTAASKGEGEAA